MPQVSTVPPEALPQIPSALQVEHRVIHEALLRATKAPGDIGTAARELAGALHDHFVREEELALPPLGLLAALETRGEAVLVAPPGAGKTTRVAPALLKAAWVAGGKISVPTRITA